MKWEESMDASEIESKTGSFPFISTYQGDRKVAHLFYMSMDFQKTS
jgi:hypothetical protein